MALATVIGIAVTLTGLAASYSPDLPVGPVIVLVAGGVYLVSSLTTRALARRRARSAVSAATSGGNVLGES